MTTPSNVPISSVPVNGAFVWQPPGSDSLKAYVMTVSDPTKNIFIAKDAKTKAPRNFKATDVVKYIPEPSLGPKLLAQ